MINSWIGIVLRQIFLEKIWYCSTVPMRDASSPEGAVSSLRKTWLGLRILISI